MTRAELAAIVVTRIGRTDKTSVINSGLDAGIKELCRYHQFRSLIKESDLSVANDSNEVDLSSISWKHLDEVRLINGTMSSEIHLKTKKWIVNRWPNVTASTSAYPLYGYIEGDVLYLYPVSNDDYTIRVSYLQKVIDFEGDDTENPVPELDFALGCWATAFVFDSVEQYEKAQVLYSRASSSLKAAILEDKRDRSERIFQPHAGRTKPESPQPWLDPFVKESR